MVGQLPQAVDTPTGSEEWIVYVNGVPMTITSEQVASIGGAANPYILQWAVWFNSTPQASELLALYVSPVQYQYAANFVGSFSASPIVNPTASFTLDIDRQSGGEGAWATIGNIGVSTAGVVTFTTAEGAAVTINQGDRLRVVGPSTADATIAGFAATFKGAPLT